MARIGIIGSSIHRSLHTPAIPVHYLEAYRAFITKNYNNGTFGNMQAGLQSWYKVQNISPLVPVFQAQPQRWKLRHCRASSSVPPKIVNNTPAVSGFDEIDNTTKLARSNRPRELRHRDIQVAAEMLVLKALGPAVLCPSLLGTFQSQHWPCPWRFGCAGRENCAHASSNTWYPNMPSASWFWFGVTSCTTAGKVQTPPISKSNLSVTN